MVTIIVCYSSSLPHPLQLLLKIARRYLYCKFSSLLFQLCFVICINYRIFPRSTYVNVQRISRLYCPFRVHVRHYFVNRHSLRLVICHRVRVVYGIVFLHAPTYPLSCVRSRRDFISFNFLNCCHCSILHANSLIVCRKYYPVLCCELPTFPNFVILIVYSYLKTSALL